MPSWPHSSAPWWNSGTDEKAAAPDVFPENSANFAGETQHINRHGTNRHTLRAFPHRNAPLRDAHRLRALGHRRGLLRHSRRRGHAGRTPRRKRAGALLRTPDLQGNAPPTLVAHPEPHGDRGRRPECLHGQGGNHLLHRLPEGTLRPRHRPAGRHRTVQHLPAGGDEQGGGSGHRRNRELQRLAGGADFRRLRKPGLPRPPARAQHPGRGRTPAPIPERGRAALRHPALPPGPDGVLRVRAHRPRHREAGTGEGHPQGRRVAARRPPAAPRTDGHGRRTRMARQRGHRNTAPRKWWCRKTPTNRTS